MKWKWIAFGLILFSVFSIAKSNDMDITYIVNEPLKFTITAEVPWSNITDKPADCGAGECVYGTSDGSWECRACSGGDGGVSMWVDGGTYIYPNDTYADNVWIQGWLNVTNWLKVWTDSVFESDLNVTGDLIVEGNTTTGNLIVNDDASIGGNMDLDKDLKLGGSINESSGNSWWKFVNGQLIIHLE